MKREHGNTHLRDILNTLRDGVIDIKQLHVEEDFLLRRHKAFCEIETTRKTS